MDAQEESTGELVQVTIQTESNCFVGKENAFHVERNLKTWAQAVVSGASKVVIGTKDKGGTRILAMKTILTEELSNGVEMKEECLQFTHRLLDWIKAQLPNHDTNTVKKFSWIPGKNNVLCSDIPEKEVEKLLIPRMYFNNSRI